VVDEYTSVVDRTVAQGGNAAVAKVIRKKKLQFVAATCHDDVEEWLQPDWVYRPAENARPQ
jgi:ABC-type ATPase with predicted acetyltransferase domain